MVWQSCCILLQPAKFVLAEQAVGAWNESGDLSPVVLRRLVQQKQELFSDVCESVSAISVL